MDLFGPDDDVQSSRFASNLKKETYNPLIITFNAITSGIAKTAKQSDGKQSDGKQSDDKPSSTSPQNTLQILTQKSVLSSSASSPSPMDLDSAQKRTQDTSCDYVVYVPTSFDITADKMNAFYESKHKFRQTFGKLNLNDAAASVFMQRAMFEDFVKFARKNTHKRELALIEQSYNSALADSKPLIQYMEQPQVWKLTDLSVPIVKTPANLSTLFAILYTTPVNGIGLPFLPLASELVSRLEWAKHAIDSYSAGSLALIPPALINVAIATQAYNVINAGALAAIVQALTHIQAAVRTNPAGAAAAIAQATASIQLAQQAAQAALVNLNIGGLSRYFLEAVRSVANLPQTITFNDEMAAISQKALTYFCSYFQILYMKTDIVAVPAAANPITSSVGRMPTYLPALNSSLSLDSFAPPVHNMNIFPVFAKPSYNVQIITEFLRGIITGTGLPNREPLSHPELKLKDIQNKTHLYTFKSTPDNSLNYETLLKRLYYKFPSYLTPEHRVSPETKKAISDAAVAAAAVAGGTFNNCLAAAIDVCDKTKSYSIICAVAIATRAFIANRAAGANAAAAILTTLFTTIDFAAGPNVDVKAAIAAYLNNPNPVLNGIVQNQLNPLIGAACAAGNAVYAAAKRGITQVVIANSTASGDDGISAIRAAMDSEINNQTNFAAFMYDNNTLLSLMKYSDQAQSIDAASVNNQPPPQISPNVQSNLLPYADYLKTLYKRPNPNLEQQSQTQVQLEEQKFDEIDDDMLYAVCGPVYFDYNWIFKQHPELIKHILGVERKPDPRTINNEWMPSRPDPLTGNVYYINRAPTNPEYPKMRFDNPKKNALSTTPRQQQIAGGIETISWAERYVSPEQAKVETTLTNLTANANAANAAAIAMAANRAIRVANAMPPNFQRDTNAAQAYITGGVATQNDINARYSWAFPGYYRYELTQTVRMNAQPNAYTNRYYQLMRPYTSDVQDYTQPNLPTAYPPPLPFIVPPMRGPDNTCMIHVWLPDLSSQNSPSFAKFMSMSSGGANGIKTLNRNAYQDYVYKMVQLIFKTAKRNASENTGSGSSGSSGSGYGSGYGSEYGSGYGSGYGYGYGSSSSSSSKRRICIKVMAIGYDLADRNLKEITNADDRAFIGDAFFFAVRDYSMLFEQDNISAAVYYDTTKQPNVKQRYDDYAAQRKSQTLRINPDPRAASLTLNLQIRPSDEFFTLRYPNQLNESDLLYFVDYCSSPRAVIGNSGEWPQNIEEIMDQAIGPQAQWQPLIKCLYDAFAEINQLYTDRGINEKMQYIANSLNAWNARQQPALLPPVVSQPRMVQAYKDTFHAAANTGLLDAGIAAAAAAVRAAAIHPDPVNLNVSWWNGAANGYIPLNAHMSSFDEHVMVLHNILSDSYAVDNQAPQAASAFVNPTLQFRQPDTTANPNPPNVSENYGPYIPNAVAPATQDKMVFENTVYAYTQAKKILTLLSKMYDNVQITRENNQRIQAALNALNALPIDFSWSMDSKFAAAVGDGAFIPNSSALHNAFICPKLMDPTEWKFEDFEDVAIRNVDGADPTMPSQLKLLVDKKLQGMGMSQSQSVGKGTSNSIIMISKQPRIATLKKNFGIILENLFHKNAPFSYQGKVMRFNNYAWPDQHLYYKMRMRNDSALTQQQTSSDSYPYSANANRPIDFAGLMGLRPQSGNCIGFPLFVVQLMFYLFEGNIADIKGMDMARLSCALDGNMFKTNVQIVWEQMMENFKLHQQNFTTMHLLNRLEYTMDKQMFDYVAYFDGDDPANLVLPIHSATILMNCTKAATNPTLKTTNYDKLKKINEQIPASVLATNAELYNSPAIVGAQIPANGGVYNSIKSLVAIAEAFNDVELHGVAGVPFEQASITNMATLLNNLTNADSTGQAGGPYASQPITSGPARIGWNAANQSESTMLYMNTTAMVNGSAKNITRALTTLKPGDEIIITATGGAKQTWTVSGPPVVNPKFAQVMNVPVTYFYFRLSKFFSKNIPNNAPLKVELQRFTHEALD